MVRGVNTDLAGSAPVLSSPGLQRVAESSAQQEDVSIYQQKCFVRNKMQGNNRGPAVA